MRYWMQNKFLAFLGLVKKTGNVVEGYNKCEEAFKYKKRIYLVIFSNDISIKSRKNFMFLCDKNNIPYIQYYSKEELGTALGRAEINVMAITDNNMAKKLQENFNSVMSQKTIGGE